MDFNHCCAWNPIKLEQSLIWFGDCPPGPFFVSPYVPHDQVHNVKTRSVSRGWKKFRVSLSPCLRLVVLWAFWTGVRGVTSLLSDERAWSGGGDVDEILQNMDVQDQSQAMSDDCFSQGRRKSEPRGWQEAEGRNGKAPCLLAFMPSQCVPLPLRFPRGHEWSEWMMDSSHKNAPILLSPSSPFTGMSEASTPTTTITTAT